MVQMRISRVWIRGRGCWTWVAVMAGALGCACRAAPPLDVHMTPLVTEVALLEVVPVVVTLRNSGRERLEIDSDLFVDDAVGSVVVRTPAGDTIVITRPVFKSHTLSSGRRVLAPGERIEREMYVGCDWSRISGSLFGTAGEYEMAVHYADDDLSGRSAPITISVIEPPETDKAALRLIRGMTHPEVLYEPAMSWIREDPATMKQLRTLASLRESEIYANYARLTLAAWHIERARRQTLYPSHFSYTVAEELGEARSLLGAVRRERRNERWLIRARMEELERQVEDIARASSSSAQGDA